MRVSLTEAAQLFGQAADRLPERVQRAEERSLAALEQAAIRRSQGPLQPTDLDRLKHPYSRRRLRLNPNIVNKWTGAGGGEFERGWTTEPPKLRGGTFTAVLHNTSPQAGSLEAGLVFGEPLMEPRLPHEDAYLEIAGERERRIDDVWDAIF